MGVWLEAAAAAAVVEAAEAEEILLALATLPH